MESASSKQGAGDMWGDILFVGHRVHSHQCLAIAMDPTKKGEQKACKRTKCMNQTLFSTAHQHTHRPALASPLPPLPVATPKPQPGLEGKICIVEGPRPSFVTMGHGTKKGSEHTQC